MYNLLIRKMSPHSLNDTLNFYIFYRIKCDIGFRIIWVIYLSFVGHGNILSYRVSKTGNLNSASVSWLWLSKKFI